MQTINRRKSNRDLDRQRVILRGSMNQKLPRLRWHFEAQVLDFRSTLQSARPATRWQPLQRLAIQRLGTGTTRQRLRARSSATGLVATGFAGASWHVRSQMPPGSAPVNWPRAPLTTQRNSQLWATSPAIHRRSHAVLTGPTTRKGTVSHCHGDPVISRQRHYR